MGEKIMTVLKSPWTKIGATVLLVFAVLLFGSWTTQKSMEGQISSFAQYQFSQSVETVLKKDGGVMDQLADIKSIATDAKNGVETQSIDSYYDTISDIQKFYKRAKAGETGITAITKENLDKVSRHWAKMPDEYKTDIVKTQYNYIMSLYDKVK